MKTSTAIVIGAGVLAVVALIALRPKPPAQGEKGTADILAGAFSFGTSLVGYLDDDDDGHPSSGGGGFLAEWGLKV